MRPFTVSSAATCHSDERGGVIPVRKLMTRSSMKTVSETPLKTIQWTDKSSLKKEMATGRMMRLAISSSSIIRSQ